ncbi:MAG: FAD-binding monooxygenase, partial [Blastocatellia bacterium]
MENFDVTVIGAGLAGLYCARQLAGNGLKVLLVDRRHNLAQKIHTTGIFVRKTLEDFEFPPNCLGPVINNVSLYAPSGRAIHLRSDHDEFRIGRMGHLYQHYLTDCLDLGVCWRPATTYQDFNVQTATLRLSDGLVRTRYLIGADGSCSRVAVD